MNRPSVVPHNPLSMALVLALGFQTVFAVAAHGACDLGICIRIRDDLGEQKIWWSTCRTAHP